MHNKVFDGGGVGNGKLILTSITYFEMTQNRETNRWIVMDKASIARY